MYRLLIADDEALEREGLELMVERNLPGVFEIFQAKNGREAIEQAEEYKPDLVLMDIKMPGIQGLEALKKIQQVNPKTKMVLVTAYDYFTYAKEAVSIGVKDYILKPAKREQVVAILKQLISELDEEREKRHEQLKLQEKLSEVMPLVESEMVMMLMADHVQELDLAHLAELIDFHIDQGYAIVIAFPLGSSGKKIIYEAVKNLLKSHLSCIVGPMIGSQMTVFVKAERKGAPYSSTETAKRLGEWIEKHAGVKVSIGTGSIRQELDGLSYSYREAVQALADKNVHRDQPEQQLRMICEVKRNKGLAIIERAQAFIREHYCEEISMEQAAEHVNLSPYYFSKIFKNESGVTFTDYLTDLRIQKAKELMAEKQLTLKEVCYEVGYKDPNYFSRVFKRVTGVTPTEYRQQLSIF